MMDEETFIRERIREARESKGLSQRQMAQLYGATQATVSDIERGRVQISAAQVARFARITQKPITYFYPDDIGGLPETETQLIALFHQFPERWQQRALYLLHKQAEVYERIKEYEQVGIPEEYYEPLIWEIEEKLRMSDAAHESISDEEARANEAFYYRFLDWFKEANVKLRSTRHLRSDADDA